MATAIGNPRRDLQAYEPNPQIVYSIDAVQQLLHVPRRRIVVYYKHGLISPVVDPECGGYFFNDEAIRALRRIEYLHEKQGVNLTGIKIILDLMKELESLQDEKHSRRNS